ncbi:MAG: hypothetical protein QM571_05765 [Micrococcaceae bacterium]
MQRYQLKNRDLSFKYVLAWFSALILAFLLLTYFAIYTYAGQILDENISKATHSNMDFFYGNIHKFLTPFLLFETVIMALGIGIYAIKTKLIAQSIIVGIFVLGINFLVRTLKFDVIERPQLFLTVLHYIDKYNPNTFPSSHTTVLASLASAILIIAAPRYKAVLGFWATTAAVIMSSILYLGVFHRASDVLASFLLVTSFSIITMLILVIYFGLEPVETIWQSKWFTIAKIIVVISLCGLVLSTLTISLGFANSAFKGPMILLATVMAITGTGFSLYLLQIAVLRKLLRSS